MSDRGRVAEYKSKERIEKNWRNERGLEFVIRVNI
jgi:hypothetical protein